MPADRSWSQLGYNDFTRILVFFIVGVALSIFNDVLHGTRRQLAMRSAEAQRQKKAAQRSEERLARVIDSKWPRTGIVLVSGRGVPSLARMPAKASGYLAARSITCSLLLRLPSLTVEGCQPISNALTSCLM